MAPVDSGESAIYEAVSFCCGPGVHCTMCPHTGKCTTTPVILQVAPTIARNRRHCGGRIGCIFGTLYTCGLGSEPRSRDLYRLRVASIADPRHIGERHETHNSAGRVADRRSIFGQIQQISH